MSTPRNSTISHSSSLSEITATSAMNNSSVISVPDGCVTIHILPFLPWDNPDNIVPKEVDNIINLLFTGICLPLLYIVSFCTNSINMVVFYKHGLKERINACLFTLSLTDLLSMTVAFGYCSDVMYMYVIGKGGDLGPSAQFFIRNHLIGLHGLLLASQMVYTVIALERCLCVTRPLLVKNFMSTKTTVVVLWTTVLITAGVTVFMGAVQYSVLCLFDAEDNSVFYINYPTEFYFRNKFIIDVTYSLVLGLFFPTSAFISVTVCTIITAVKLKQLSQWRETVSSASGSVSSRDLAITRVIIGTSILFIICIVPSVVIPLSFTIVPDLGFGGHYDNLAWVFRRFYQLSIAINNSFNFFVYYGYGSRFRETTHSLFPCWHREDSSQKKTTTSSGLQQ